MAVARYVGEDALGYGRIRWAPGSGEALRFDQRYLAAQLPLVNPRHRDVVAQHGDYRMGHYARPRTSLVLPVPAVELEASPAFRALDDAIRAGALGRRVAWPAMLRRRGLLHATICAGLDEGEVEPVAASVLAHLERRGPPRFRVGGPLVGQLNRGRVYFPVFPEDGAGGNAFHAVQDAASRPRTDVYLVGYYNLTDHLDEAETHELGGILEAHGKKTLLETSAGGLWILRTNDDLVLSGEILRDIRAPVAVDGT